ncbi:MAG: hypothetical protein LBF75_07020 [Treponema sp.]|nr:hypothetical protein [Treponema sp.]
MGRDISTVPRIPIATVLTALKSTKYRIKPKQHHYDYFEIDEFWMYVGERSYKDGTKAQETDTTDENISCEYGATDAWERFLAPFGEAG